MSNIAETDKMQIILRSLEEATEAEYMIAGITRNAPWREAARRPIIDNLGETDNNTHRMAMISNEEKAALKPHYNEGYSGKLSSS